MSRPPFWQPGDTWQPPIVRIKGVDEKSPAGQELMRAYEGTIKQFYLGQARAHALGTVDNSRGRKQFPQATMTYTNMAGQEILDIEFRPELPKPPPKKEPVEKVIQDYVILDLNFPDSAGLIAAVDGYTEAANGADPSTDNWLDYNDVITSALSATESLPGGSTNYGRSILIDLSKMPETIVFDVLITIRAFNVGFITLAPARWGYKIDQPAYNQAPWDETRDEIFFGGIVCTLATGDTLTPYAANTTSGYPGGWLETGSASTQIATLVGGSEPPDRFDLYAGAWGTPWPATIPPYYRDPNQTLLAGSYVLEWQHFDQAAGVQWYEGDHGACGFVPLGRRLRDWYYRFALNRNRFLMQFMQYFTRVQTIENLDTVELSYATYPKYTQFSPYNDQLYVAAESIQNFTKKMWAVAGATAFTEKTLIGSAPVLTTRQESWVDPYTPEPAGWVSLPEGVMDPYVGKVRVRRLEGTHLSCEWIAAGSAS